MEDRKFAVLIDGDNTSAKYIKTIIDETTKEGVITYNRVYGDWTSPNFKKWREVLLTYALTPVQQCAYTQGKNSTDSAMIIDAMDILYTGTVDGFCIVSSDSDFTRLVTRLREAGKIVIGMGQSNTTKAFVTACNKFKYVDVISEETKNSGVLPSAIEAENITTDTVVDKKAAAQANLKTKEKELKKAIDTMLDENSDDDGWLLASTVGTLLQRQFSDFDSRNYGFKKTIELLRHLGYETGTENGKVYRIRKKPAEKKTTKNSKKKQ